MAGRIRNEFAQEGMLELISKMNIFAIKEIGWKGVCSRQRVRRAKT